MEQSRLDEGEMRLAFEHGSPERASRVTTLGIHRPRNVASGAHLTGRQAEVLRLVERGRSNKAIARALGLSMSTVKTHLRTIFSLLEARSRTEAVAKGRDLGWL